MQPKDCLGKEEDVTQETSVAMIKIIVLPASVFDLVTEPCPALSKPVSVSALNKCYPMAHRCQVS